MSLFGMGPTEFLVIAVIAFIIFGPEKFTELAGTAGKFVREFRAMSGGLTGEFQQAMNEFQDLGGEIRQVTGEVQGQFQDIGGEIRQVTGELQDSTHQMLSASDPRIASPRTISNPTATPSFVRDTRTVGARPTKADPLADFGLFAEATPTPEKLSAEPATSEAHSSQPAA